MSEIERVRAPGPGARGGPVRTHLRSVAVAAAALVAAVEATSAQDRWLVESASVGFEVRNAGLPVRGTFERVDARVCFDPDRPEVGVLEGTVHPGTIRTGIPLRDRHLRRRGWFDAERYGKVSVRSVRLGRRAEGFAGRFLLRIRDVEREVVIPFTFEREGWRAHLRGSSTIDRLDFGLGRPSIVLADSVTISVELGLLRQEPPSGDPCR